MRYFLKKFIKTKNKKDRSNNLLFKTIIPPNLDTFILIKNILIKRFI
jgi:hypothetical protein